MHLVVEWRSDEEVAELALAGRLQTLEDVENWREIMVTQLDALTAVKGRVRLLICIDNFEIDPAMADAYGKVARMIGETYALAIARYGVTSRIQRLISLEAAKKNYRVNLFESREDALNHLRTHG